jgi:hypothetical protein
LPGNSAFRDIRGLQEEHVDTIVITALIIKRPRRAIFGQSRARLCSSSESRTAAPVMPIPD